MGIFENYYNNYLDKNYSVIPVDAGTKRCSMKNWSQFCDRLPTEEETDSWLTELKWRKGGIGLCLGKASGLMAIDFDYQLSDHNKVEQMIKGILPPTTVMKKGQKGWTAFFRYNPDIKTLRIDKTFEGNTERMIDVLSDGTFTVLPPTIHPVTKKKYYWLTPDNLEDITSDDLEMVTTEMIEALYAITQITKNEDFQSIASRGAGRHMVVFGHVIKKITTYKSLDKMVDDMISFDRDRHAIHPKGPYFEDSSYIKGDPRDFVKKFAERIVKFKKKKSLEDGFIWDIGTDLEYPSKMTGFFKIVEKTNRKGELYTQLMPEYYDLAEYMKNEDNFICDDSKMYIYKDSYYNPVTKLGLKNIISRLTLNNASVNQVNNFYETTRTVGFNKIDENPIENKINLKNGILDLVTKELEPHSSKYFFKYKLPHSYKTDAYCIEWLEFLDRIFCGDGELINLSAEIFGYAIAGGDPWLHKAFLLYGEGRNGKSTYIDVLSHMLGGENISSIPIENLGKPFSVVMADGKLANVVGEMTAREVDSSAFKTAVGGEYLIASHKGMAEYRMKFNAKMFFACNKLPIFRDATSGAYEKLCIIPFNYYFEKSDRVPMFAHKKLFPEMPGILNWALDGYERLLKRKMLPDVGALDAQLLDYRIVSDSVLHFYNECIEIRQPQGFESVKYKKMGDFFTSYVTFCHKNGRNPSSKETFSSRMNKCANLEMRKNKAIAKKVERRYQLFTNFFLIS